MATGLLALLDDVAVLVRTAAASLDDIGAATLKAGSKSAGVIIDDAAVTPKYVVGFASDREIPIVRQIAFGSLKNKILFLLPGALLLSWLAPWLITPLLMLGGFYLAFEGAEKVMGALGIGGHGSHGKKEILNEEATVRSAVRTDFILSAEIMALTLSTVAGEPMVTQGVVLGLVGIFITFLVYGSVALIVRADDFGVALAANHPNSAWATLGRGIVKGMPKVLKALSIVGTAAMLWVGGGILIHGLHEFHIVLPEAIIHAATEAVHENTPVAAGLLGWATGAILAGVLGITVGGLIVMATSTFRKKPLTEA